MPVLNAHILALFIFELHCRSPMAQGIMTLIKQQFTFGRHIQVHAKFGGYVLAWEFSFPLLPSYQPFLYFCSMYGYEL